MCAHLLSVTLLCDTFYYTRRYSSRDFTDDELGECVLDVVLQVLQTAFMAFSFVKVRVARHFVWPVGAALMRLPHWQQPRSLCPPPWLLCSPEICSICRGASVSAGQGQHGCRPSFARSEEHTSELQSHLNLVCRLLLEKKKKTKKKKKKKEEEKNTIQWRE